MEIHSTTVYDKKTVEIFTRENLKKLLPLNIVVLIIATIIFLESIYEVAALGNPLEVMFGPLFLFGILYSQFRCYSRSLCVSQPDGQTKGLGNGFSLDLFRYDRCPAGL